MSQVEVLEEKKIARIAKTAAKVGKLQKLYFEALKALNKTVPPETRSATASFAAKMRKAMKGELSPEELGVALLEMKKEWRSWKVEHAEDIRFVSGLAKQFFAALRELEILTEDIQEQ